MPPDQSRRSTPETYPLPVTGMKVGADWTVHTLVHSSHALEFWHCSPTNPATLIDPVIAVFPRQDAGQSDSIITPAGSAWLAGKTTDLHHERLIRLAYLSTSLPERHVERCLATMLDAPAPHVLFPYREAMLSADWFCSLPQPASLTTLLALATHLVDGLSHLHRLGFAHTRIEPQNILIHADGLPRLAGMGNCLPIATRVDNSIDSIESAAVPIKTARTQPSPDFLPPECKGGEYEVCLAQDIYQLAVLFGVWFGPRLLNSPLGRAMRAANPADRPTASDLSILLSDFVNRLGLPRSGFKAA